MPDCRKSHLIFQNFLGESPQTPRRRSRLRRSVRGFAPLPGPPFQNSWIRPWFELDVDLQGLNLYRAKNWLIYTAAQINPLHTLCAVY